MIDHNNFSTLQFEALDEFCGSPFWNKTLTWNTNDPTFTACFEKTVLVWIPALFLWIFAPFEIIGQIESFNKDIPWTWKNSLKFFINTLICTICVSDFIANTNNSEVVGKADIFMPLLKLLTFGLALLLAYRNKIHGVPSSGPLFLFWLLSAFCGIPQFRSEIRYAQKYDSYDYYEYFSYIVYYPLIVAMFILNCFYDGVPRVYPYGKFENPSPEPLASFLSKKTVYFFEHFMYKAFRNPVEMKHLWDLEPENQAGNLIPKFDKYFNRRIEKGINKFTRKNTAHLNNGLGDSARSSINVKKRKDTNVLPVLWKCLWRPLTGGMIIRLITDSLQFVNPQLLGLVIGFVGSTEPLWKGILYATIMFVVAATMSFANTTHANWFFRIGQQSKTILISAIYRKSLRISNSARKHRTVGEIVNLMSTDAQKFQEVVMFLNFLLSAPLSIALALFFLYQELGIASLAGLVTMLALVPINIFIVNRSRNLQIKQMKLKDERIKIMNEVLTGMKVLKLYAWEECFEKEISKIRDKEIVTLKKAAYLNGVSQFLWNCTPFVVSCATFAVYVTIDPNNNRLDVAKAFVSIALLNVLRGPMALLPGVINQIIQTLVSVRRINSFLNADELEFYVTHHQNTEVPVLIEDGTFSWGDEPILRNINLKVFDKNLTAIVGAVGTGKSSLISAILGEMDKISGSINIFGSIAYVPQQSWVQNATVQDNITFGKVFEKERYLKVIESCALRADFNMLPNGDQTEIGEKGINLSGGQKQRISLARAVYADCDIYLLDDPLSAVDAHVGKHIFTHLIGPQGLLSKKTRILVTHAITYLPQTDNIAVLKDGRISEDGTYQELLAKKGHFSDFILQHITENINNNEELNEIETQIGNIQLPKDVSQTLTRQISRQRSRISESGSISSLDLQVVGKSSSRESLRSLKRPSILSKRKMSPIPRLENEDDMKNSLEKGKLITEENAEKGNVKLTVFLYYLKSIGICSIVGTLIGSILFQSFSVGSTAWLGKWAEDENMIKNNETNIPLRNLYLGVYGGMGACLGLSIFVAAIIFARGSMNAAKTLHNFMLHNILRLPMTFFDTTPSGRILSRFSTDISSIDLRLPMALNVFFIQGFRIIFTFAVIIYTTPIFTVAIIPLLGLYIFIQRYYVAASRQLKRIDSVSRSPIYSKFSETLSGTHIIRAYNHVERFVHQSDEQINKNQQAMYASNTASIWLTIRLENIGNAIIFFSALFAVLSKNIDPALIGMSVSYAMTITGTLNFLVRMISDVETTIISVERLKEYGEITQEAPWDIAEKTPSKEWPQNGLVEFKDYSLKYRKELDLVLKSINFKIMGGEKVGIVGRTGAGKSSLTLALFRIIEAAEGAILIDGSNISEMGLHALRSRLTIIPQDAVLFSGSIRMNLDPFEQCSDEEVWKALELAHLKDFIKSLTGGLSHAVTEGGENLSVGQRQLICLARALLRKTRILILDEATAAIDLETDELIQITIRTAFKDCTVLTIAHRLDTIIDSDRVLVLDKGEVAEFDQPDVLLENKNSIFFSMCKDAGLVS